MTNVTAIFKKGEKYQPSNYRPVSYTCTAYAARSKSTSSSVMCSNTYLDKHHILTDCQHWFRARRSCEIQLLTLAEVLVTGLDKKLQHDLIVLDLSKAFDRVRHQRLLGKSDLYGVIGSILRWIMAFLTDRTQQVTVEGATPDSVEVLSAVPQGTVLGPLLFLIFINDVPGCLQSTIRLFADECILYRCIETRNDCTVLQDDPNCLAAWE